MSRKRGGGQLLEQRFFASGGIEVPVSDGGWTNAWQVCEQVA